ncbi:putative thioredoxin [Desulfosarcina variabilis str. Montpellier]|jgi:thioredoxin-related protein|uniref:thioredoxin family protein n=1 Tax=Desulfosarcina variabilis TaxID=2300 RepID=UPI003AFB0775
MQKKWYLTIVVLVLMVIPFLYNPAPQAAQNGDGIQWMAYEEGRKRGETEKKKVFLVFNADWCRYCLKMEKETFQNPSVIAYVNRNFVPISVNSDRQQAIATKYKVTGLPSTWFIAENGAMIGNRPGYIPPKEMLSILKYINSDSYQTMSFKTFVEKNN